MSEEIKGRVNSIQSMGTLDGPGVRYVVFTQGCPLRCSCCHNPDTWDTNGGDEYLASEIVSTGGEPLLQPDFAREIFVLSKEKGVNTCLDTSGAILNDKVKELLKFTDRVLLDVKYDNDADYKAYVGCSLDKVVEFLQYLQYQLRLHHHNNKSLAHFAEVYKYNR